MSYPYEAYDVMIIGGGVNGVGIAAEAASRGLRTVLIEQGDFANATSSATSQLIHGGLHYLEDGHFSLARESLFEQSVLLKRAPHLVRPLPTIIPIHQQHTAYWKLRSSLFLYDALSPSQTLPRAQKISLEERFPAGFFQPSLHKGLCFFDATTDDARLVMANALWAKEQGAALHTYHQAYQIEYDHYHWTVRIRHGLEYHTLHSKVLINATGRWVSQLPLDLKKPSSEEIEWIQGIHLIVPRLFPGDHAAMLKAEDGHTIFIVPYNQKFHMIGSSSVKLSSPDQSAPTPEEQHYLLSSIQHYFKRPIVPEEIIKKTIGVRTLLAQTKRSASTQEYQLRLHTHVNHPPLMHVIGGSISMYRSLSEKAVDLLKNVLPIPHDSWSAKATLPGGNIDHEDIQSWIQEQQHKHPHLPAPFIQRLCQGYGSHYERIVEGRKTIPDLGIHFGADVYQSEIEYILKNESVRYFQDLIWRRTKFGLFLNKEEQLYLKDWVCERYGVI